VRNEITARRIVDRIRKNLGVLCCLLLLSALTASTNAVNNTAPVEGGLLEGAPSSVPGVRVFKGIPCWPAFDANNHITMELGEKTGTRPIAETARFEFFEKFFARQRTQ
jgi:hypothetical protein